MLRIVLTTLTRNSGCLLKRKVSPNFSFYNKLISGSSSRLCIADDKPSYKPHNAGTMAEVKEEIMKRLGLEPGYQPIPKPREHLLKYQPKVEDLPARSMSDSFTSATIPLRSNKAKQDKYVSLVGKLRMGRLMEDMDMFAVWVCHKHLKVPNLPDDVPLPYTFVTLLVDNVDYSHQVDSVDADIILSGHVTWVGKSSMEIAVWVEEEVKGEQRILTRARFLMVARNATNTGAAPVNPLVPDGDEEVKILSGGEQRKKHRQMVQASSIFKVEPNDYEQTLMYQLYQRTTDSKTMELNKRILPPNCRWMSESFITSTVASFPENRNAHNSVFGGFLMRSAVEISWVSASLYSKSRCKIRNICDISFERPVSVDSFLKMTAYVVYTKMNLMEIMAVIDVIQHSGEQFTSNVMYLTFESPHHVPEVLPRSYQETMWYIQGRRKFNYALGLDQ